MLRHGTCLWVTLVFACGACIEEAEFPPAYGAYMGVVVLGDVSGRMSWGPPQGGAFDPQGRAAWMRNFLVGPDLAPDFIDQAIPPFCMAFAWPGDGVPNLNAVDAGELAIAGYETTQQYVWGVNPPPAPTAMPPSIGCQRGPVPGGAEGQFGYGCNIEPMVGLTGPLLRDDTQLTISANGGQNIGAFEETELRAPAALEPTFSFDLNQIDVSQQVIAAWENTSADTVMIEIFAQVTDFANPASKFGQVLCLEPAASGQKVIPPAALAVLPKASGTDALMLQTTLVGVSLRQSRQGWGSYMVGAGRGTLGITCRTSRGDLCPPPGGGGE